MNPELANLVWQLAEAAVDEFLSAESNARCDERTVGIGWIADAKGSNSSGINRPGSIGAGPDRVRGAPEKGDSK